jgi:hypothetical protein
MTLYNFKFLLGNLSFDMLISATNEKSAIENLINIINNDQEIKKIYEDIVHDDFHVKQMLKYSVDWFKCGFLEFCKTKFSTIGFETIINIYLNRLSMDELRNINQDKEYREKDKIVIYWLFDYFKKIYIKISDLIKIEKITEIKDGYYITKIKDNNDD